MSKYEESAEIKYELESSFILRVCERGPALLLREMIRSGQLKDRMSIYIEDNNRHGMVSIDNWMLYCTFVDLPTIIESAKTTDRKLIYKTADISQMLICSFQPFDKTEKPNKKSHLPDYKVNKKYLWPHGLAPCLKNVKKSRFRKTLKKEFVEQNEIENELKHLFRADFDAIDVKYEIFYEDTPEKIAGQRVKVNENDIFGSSLSEDENSLETDVLEIENNGPEESVELLNDKIDEQQRSNKNKVENKLSDSSESNSIGDYATKHSVDYTEMFRELKNQVFELQIQKYQIDAELLTIKDGNEKVYIIKEFQRIKNEIEEKELACSALREFM